MIKGVFLGLAACLIWGLLCVIPQFIEDFNTLEISLGRYFFFGLISLFFFTKAKINRRLIFPFAIWRRAIFFSLVCTFGYYLFFVFGIRNTSPALGTLIIGLCPILSSFYGNWKEREGNFRKILLPSFLIFLGLLFTNVSLIDSDVSISYRYFLGLLSCFAALLSWSWYIVANASFLKRNPEISSSDWSTLIGLGGFFWVFVFGIIFWSLGIGIQTEKYSFSNPAFRDFLVASIVLGFLCSWVGAFLWNRASFYLPISLTGQLIVFEMIFGLFFVYLAKRSLPSFPEALGITLFFIATCYAIRKLDLPHARGHA